MTLFVDSSAFVAVIFEEAQKNKIIEFWRRTDNVVTSPIVRLEVSMVVAQRFKLLPSQAEEIFDALLLASNINIVPISDEIGSLAVLAYEKYGKGRHPARLNLADCFSYAVAKSLGLKILFVGDDFAKTDLKPAL